MNDTFVRSGPLKELCSYPHWAQRLVQECETSRLSVIEHPLYARMRDGQLSRQTMRAFLIGGWQVVEQFPLYMSHNLLKTRFGRSPGEDMARRWLMRNIRVELNHADYWVRWAEAYGVTLAELKAQLVPAELHALGHWCWHSCATEELALAMAATNYAIEGATGDWSALVCSTDTYERSLPAGARKDAMRWLKMHARYDDDHPWEALEIICTLCGPQLAMPRCLALREAICKSYGYMRMFLDQCLALEQAQGGALRTSSMKVAG
ncbi:iron-containing redox enzyme family protein [Pseudomonas sp. PDM18]|uniref:TenA family transcriptional regulator n=1 Tax=Pseudomonas sp. PDM18 TaxID=2769253 RepID=UPI00177AA3AA|nr:iron-containing redox enzyme family protein [Pseudomonas sp. PDM18]MBD9675315.1 iron-containing redox enzyme family protein [Pseudomonas sp. PDM18]